MRKIEQNSHECFGAFMTAVIDEQLASCQLLLASFAHASFNVMVRFNTSLSNLITLNLF